MRPGIVLHQEEPGHCHVRSGNLIQVPSSSQGTVGYNKKVEIIFTLYLAVNRKNSIKTSGHSQYRYTQFILLYLGA